MENNNILLEETINKQTYTTKELIQKIITVLDENTVSKGTSLFSLFIRNWYLYAKGYRSYILKYKFYEFILEYYDVVIDIILYLLQNN